MPGTTQVYRKVGAFIGVFETKISVAYFPIDLQGCFFVVFFNPLAMPMLTSSKGKAHQHFLRWPFWPPACTYPVIGKVP